MHTHSGQWGQMETGGFSRQFRYKGGILSDRSPTGEPDSEWFISSLLELWLEGVPSTITHAETCSEGTEALLKVTVTAANRFAPEDAGCSFSLGSTVPLWWGRAPLATGQVPP